MEEEVKYRAGTVVERAEAKCLVLGVFKSEVLIDHQVRECYEATFRNLQTDEISSVVLRETVRQAEVGE